MVIHLTACEGAIPGSLPLLPRSQLNQLTCMKKVGAIAVQYICWMKQKGTILTNMVALCWCP